MKRNGSEVAIDAVWRAFKLPTDSKIYAIAASIIAHTIFLYFGAFMSPSDVIILSA